MCQTYVDNIQPLEEYQIFLFFFYTRYRRTTSYMFFFQNIKLYSLFLSPTQSFVFFSLVIFVFFSDHRQEERERETSNRLCHSDTSKMMFHNAFIRYLFILLLSLLSVHFTVSQSTLPYTASSGMLIATVDDFLKIL
jgi:hypothetical protein